MAVTRSTQKVVVAWSQSVVPLWMPTTAVAPSCTLVRATGPRPTCWGESGMRRTATTVTHRNRAAPSQTRPGSETFGSKDGRFSSPRSNKARMKKYPDPTTSQMYPATSSERLRRRNRSASGGGRSSSSNGGRWKASRCSAGTRLCRAWASWMSSRPGTIRYSATRSQLRSVSSRSNLKKTVIASRNEK